ncbi:MAG TPA: hypothetical protein VHV80_13425 [Steroidobacteraceae bacterium]|nr:hypothetical protein [Steroidobacteraceae bacterium]
MSPVIEAVRSLIRRAIRASQNNYTGETDPSEYARRLQTGPWNIAVAGETEITVTSAL